MQPSLNPEYLPGVLKSLGDHPDTCLAHFLLNRQPVSAHLWIDDLDNPSVLAVADELRSGEVFLFGDPDAEALPDLYPQLLPPFRLICQPTLIDSVASHLRVESHTEIITLAWLGDVMAGRPGPPNGGIARHTAILTSDDLHWLDRPAFAGVQGLFRRFDSPADLLADGGVIFGGFNPEGELLSVAVSAGWAPVHVDCEAFTRPDAQRRGYAKAACQALFRYLVAQSRRPVWHVSADDWPGLMLARRSGLRETRPPATLFALDVQEGDPLPPPPLVQNQPFW